MHIGRGSVWGLSPCMCFLCHPLRQWQWKLEESWKGMRGSGAVNGQLDGTSISGHALKESISSGDRRSFSRTIFRPVGRSSNGGELDHDVFRRVLRHIREIQGNWRSSMSLKRLRKKRRLKSIKQQQFPLLMSWCLVNASVSIIRSFFIETGTEQNQWRERLIKYTKEKPGKFCLPFNLQKCLN